MRQTFEINFDSLRGTPADRVVCCLVEINVDCRDRDGADATWDLERITVKATGEDVEIEFLDARDCKALHRRAEAVADEAACDAYQSYAEGAADQAYARWKDEQMEVGE